MLPTLPGRPVAVPRTNQLIATKASIHNLGRLGVDPVHLEDGLCNIQSICRSIHFGPSVPQVVVSKLHFGTSMPVGPGGPLDTCPPKGGGVHAICFRLAQTSGTGRKPRRATAFGVAGVCLQL